MSDYIVIDVEMCKVGKIFRQGRYKRHNEIIQIGAVMLNEKFEEVDEFSSFVHPQFGKIDGFITTLTGITPRNIQAAPSVEMVLLDMIRWIDGRDARFCSWSRTDYCQIRDEILMKDLDMDKLDFFLKEENWIDYQKVVDIRFGLDRAPSLKDALELADLDVVGHLHDGLADARNTARMIAKLELNPCYQCGRERFLVKEDRQTHLGYSLGSLLQGIVLETA